VSVSSALLGVAHYARQTPDKPALILGDAVRTYGQLDERAPSGFEFVDDLHRDPSGKLRRRRLRELLRSSHDG
jgi:acyl-CoA synthetase (AMP-forming)/AMP-acid ligase II